MLAWYFYRLRQSVHNLGQILTGICFVAANLAERIEAMENKNRALESDVEILREELNAVRQRLAALESDFYYSPRRILRHPPGGGSRSRDDTASKSSNPSDKPKSRPH